MSEEKRNNTKIVILPVEGSSCLGYQAHYADSIKMSAPGWLRQMTSDLGNLVV